MTIQELLNEVDADGKPYFTETEKLEYMMKWEQLDEKFFPSFSTSDFENKKMDKNQLEMNRLLSILKNQEERNQVEREANNWSLKTSRHPMHYIANYLRSRRDPYLKEEQYVLDLTKGNQLDESFLRQFGWLIQKVLERMFGGSDIPVSIRGSKEQISALSRTLASEKDYLTKFQQFGLDSPHTYRSKSKLETAIQKFQRATRIKVAVWG